MVFQNKKKLWFDDFRNRYTKNIESEFIVDDTPYLLKNHEILVGWKMKPINMQMKWKKC